MERKPKEVESIVWYLATLSPKDYDAFADGLTKSAAEALRTLAHAIENIAGIRRYEDQVDGEGYFIVVVSDDGVFRRSAGDILDGPYKNTNGLARKLRALQDEPHLVWKPENLRLAKYEVEGSVWTLLSEAMQQPVVDNTRTYVGVRDDLGDAWVKVNGGSLNARLEVGRHSSTGFFEWGFSSGGAAQLSLAILYDHFQHHPEDLAIAREIDGKSATFETRNKVAFWADRLTNLFKGDYIETLNPEAGWTLTSPSVTAILRGLTSRR